MVILFPTCQVRVVRFYVSCLLLSSSPLLLLLNRDPRRTVFSVGPQPRPSTPSVPCRTSTTTIPAQCSLPDLNHDHPRPVFPAGPQPRVSTPSVPCRTSWYGTKNVQKKVRKNVRQASDKSGVNKLFWNVMVGITRSKVMVISLLSYGFPMVFTASQYHPSDLSNLRNVCSRNLPPGALAGNFLATTWGNNEVSERLSISHM